MGWGKLNRKSRVSNDFFFGLQKRSSKVVADRQIRRQGRAFEHYFGSREREFKRSIHQKLKCPWFAREGGGGGGDVEVSS